MIRGINIAEVFSALQVYIGSSYVNDFNLFGRTFRVITQADAPHRAYNSRRDWSGTSSEKCSTSADASLFSAGCSCLDRAVMTSISALA